MTEFNGKIDLHMHTTVSDGTDTPEEILEKVKAADIAVFSITDHDAVKSGEIIRSILKKDDPLFITGVEFSCKDDEGKYHILGYGYDTKAQPINAVVKHGHYLRTVKLKARLDFLQKTFGFDFPKEEIDKLSKLDNPGKPHIGNLMVKLGYAQTKEQAIEEFINKAYFKNQHIGPREAIEGILASGGIPVLAHPCYGSGDELIIGEDLHKRVKKLMDYGLKGLEGYYSGFSEKLSKSVLDLADKYGLFVTAGSDYHGTNKMVTLGDTGLDLKSEKNEALMLFLESVL